MNDWRLALLYTGERERKKSGICPAVITATYTAAITNYIPIQCLLDRVPCLSFKSHGVRVVEEQGKEKNEITRKCTRMHEKWWNKKKNKDKNRNKVKIKGKNKKNKEKINVRIKIKIKIRIKKIKKNKKRRVIRLLSLVVPSDILLSLFFSFHIFAQQHKASTEVAGKVYSTEQRNSRVQYSRVQYNRVQYNRVQYNH